MFDPYKLAIKLSPEDTHWVQAIARRAMLTRGWDQDDAYKEALAAVEGFYWEQLTEIGWIEREVEHQLQIKRVAYEKETDKIAKRMEEDRQFEITRYQKRQEKLKVAKLQVAVRLKKHESLAEEFAAAGGRGRWVYREWLDGRMQSAIAGQLGISKTRVSAIVKKEERLERSRRARLYKTWLEANPNRGRPLDMGGPRDVWLTYYPSSDPRLDNMDPVQLYVQDDPADVLVERERQ